MADTSYVFKRASFCLFLLSIFLLPACAEIEVRTTQAPPLTPKIRVFIMTFSEYAGKTLGPRGYGWDSHETFTEDVYKRTGELLNTTGIYEIVPEKEVKAVLNGKTLSLYNVEKDNYALTRRVGKALHADFSMIADRIYTQNRLTSFSYYTFINIETGEKFQYGDVPQTGMSSKSDFENISKAAYRYFYENAKGDLLALAVRKGKLADPTGGAEETKTELIAKQKEEKERLERELVEQQRIEKEKIEQIKRARQKEDRERLEREQAEQRMIVKEKEEQIKLAKLIEERERLERELAEQQKIEKEKAEQIRLAKLREIQEQAERKKQAIEEKKEREKAEKERATAKLSVRPEIKTSSIDSPALTLTTVQKAKIKEIIEKQPDEANKTRIIVYDFEASESFKVAALILADALREELLKLGKFQLINRESLLQVVEELKLQGSVLSDDKQILQMSGWLTAKYAITGKISALGQSVVLQAKRFNMATMETESLSSSKCSAGNEEKFLSDMPELAKKLISSQ